MSTSKKFPRHPGQSGTHTFTADGKLVGFRSATYGVSVFRQRFRDRRGNLALTQPFYIRKMVVGKSVWFPLGVAPKAADRLADEITAFLSIPGNTLDAAFRKYNPRAIQRDNRPATIGQILAAFRSALAVIGRKGKPVSAAAFKVYRNSLFTLIRKVEAYRAGVSFVPASGRKPEDIEKLEKLTATHLTSRLVVDFKLASEPPAEDEPDEEEIVTARITADSCLRNARALFGKQALRHYKEHANLKLPDLKPFLEEPAFGARKYFQLLDSGIILRVMSDSLRLRCDDPDAYRAFLLCAQCGLRSGEAVAYQPGWLDEADDDRFILQIAANGKFNPKHGHGRKAIIPGWVAATIKELGPIQQKDAMDRLNTWLKARGVNVNKPTHELRKLWISNKAKNEGLLAAAQQGGHKDTRVTMMYYADNMMPDWLVPLWQQPTANALETEKIRTRLRELT
ncbi:hypothetical protein OPIT5_03280 [Opitutaceae bacterium TAV5]|nr:hypothetical protein OPIT5_03280 [Opitutaceae bacterium TAV5]